MSFDFADVQELKKATEEMAKAIAELELTISEITPIILLLLNAVGGEFVIDQTQEITQQFITAVLEKQIGFRVESIDGHDIVKVILMTGLEAE